jgi:hypothetical protein
MRTSSPSWMTPPHPVRDSCAYRPLLGPVIRGWLLHMEVLDSLDHGFSVPVIETFLDGPEEGSLERPRLLPVPINCSAAVSGVYSSFVRLRSLIAAC